MDRFVFLILSIVDLTFIYLVMRLAVDRMPDQAQAFVAKLTQMLPSFAGDPKADIRSSLFCGFVVLTIFLLAFIRW